MYPRGAILVDGLGVGDVGNIVLRDRQHLAEDGIMIVVMTLERYSNQLLAGPDIVSRGFVYVRESESLMEEARRVVENALDNCMKKHITDWGKIKKYRKGRSERLPVEAHKEKSHDPSPLSWKYSGTAVKQKGRSIRSTKWKKSDVVPKN